MILFFNNSSPQLRFGEFKQTTDLFHRILSDDTAKTLGVLPRTIAVALLFDEYLKLRALVHKSPIA